MLPGAAPPIGLAGLSQRFCTRLGISDWGSRTLRNHAPGAADNDKPGSALTTDQNAAEQVGPAPLCAVHAAQSGCTESAARLRDPRWYRVPKFVRHDTRSSSFELVPGAHQPLWP